MLISREGLHVKYAKKLNIGEKIKYHKSSIVSFQSDFTVMQTVKTRNLKIEGSVTESSRLC